MRPRRALLRDVLVLGSGTVISGLAAYVYVAIGIRALGAAPFAPISVLWTLWAGATAAVTFPLQHWVLRTWRASGPASVRRGLPRVGLVVVAAAVVTTLVAWILRVPLFGVSSIEFPALTGALTLECGVLGLLRGTLAARKRFTATAVVIGGENALRVLVAGVVAALGGGAVAFGAALLAAPAIGLLFPSAFRLERDRGTARPPVMSFLGGVGAGTLVAQLVLSGPPAVLAVLGGRPAEVTALFAALALFRAPYLLALGVATRATGALTGWFLEGRYERLRRLERYGALCTAGGAVGAAAVGATIGAEALELVFGSGTALPPLVLGLVAAGSWVAVGTLGQTLVLAAVGRSSRVAVAWIAGGVTAALGLLLALEDPTLSVAASFAAAETVAYLLLLFGGRHIGTDLAARRRAKRIARVTEEEPLGVGVPVAGD